VVLFINPSSDDLLAVKEILWLFGFASGLFTNFSKRSIIPIQCQDIDLAVATVFGCPIVNFPYTYLGMPLSDCHVRKVDL
jgi:hypothetical protein